MKFILIVFCYLGLVACKSASPDKSVDLILKGENFLNKRNFSSAIISFQDALKSLSEKESIARINYKIAFCFYENKELDSAKIYATKAFAGLDKNLFLYKFYAGFTEILNGNLAEANDLLSQAHKLDSENAELNYFLSLLKSGAYSDANIDFQLALEYAKKANASDENSFTKEQLAIVYFQVDEFEKAEKIYAKLKEDFPVNKLFQFNQGQCLYFLGDEQKGYELMEDAAQRDDICKKLFEDLIQE